MRATPNSVGRSPCLIESLESRRLLAVGDELPFDLVDSERLTKNDVTRILAAAASQALPTQVITVVDRDGQILGIVAMEDANLGAIPDQFGNADDPLLRTVVKSISRARTGAFFQSHENAFTPRTARFIIQDHFPHPVPNTAGGPLYGVEFSSLPGSDVYSGPAISGDPGGMPLYKNGKPVGGIGVAGDGSDRRVREGLPYDPSQLPDPGKSPDAGVNLFDGTEEFDADEQVVLAGILSFRTPDTIQATNIFVGGLRFPFLRDQPASGQPNRTLSEIVASGDGQLIVANQDNTGLPFVIGAPYSVQSSPNPRGSPGSPFPAATLGGIVGEFKNTSSRVGGNVTGNAGNDDFFGLIGSDDTYGVDKGPGKGANDVVADKDRLTKKDVQRVIEQAVRQALITRAGIRKPIGVPVRVHVAVVDRDGTLLGVFRMQDGTNFSYDVAVQKARTAAFFSDNNHAFSARAVGFVSQMFFPAGIDGGLDGPLFHLQNGLSLGGTFGVENRTKDGPLKNGITIFPGGAPLYKDGQFVGAVGVSGDGVDQDDIITFAGTKNFQAPQAIRSDALGETRIVNFLTKKVKEMDSIYDLVIDKPDPALPNENTAAAALNRLVLGLENVQLPFQKFPRNPLI